jgi:hypothetical protein
MTNGLLPSGLARAPINGASPITKMLAMGRVPKLSRSGHAARPFPK